MQKFVAIDLNNGNFVNYGYLPGTMKNSFLIKKNCLLAMVIFLHFLVGWIFVSTKPQQKPPVILLPRILPMSIFSTKPLTIVDSVSVSVASTPQSAAVLKSSVLASSLKPHPLKKLLPQRQTQIDSFQPVDALQDSMKMENSDSQQLRQEMAAAIATTAVPDAAAGALLASSVSSSLSTTLPVAENSQPASSGAVESISSPRFNVAYLNNPAPVYPPLARRLGEEGKVLLRVYVTADGAAGELQIQTGSGSEFLDNAALKAVQQWRFVPARKGESPVAAWVQVPIVFKLNE